MGAAFVKTAKGQAELTARSGALTPRARRVLILVDGKRTVADLDALIQSETLRNTLGQLEEDGFIEYLEAPAGKPAATVAGPTPPPSPAASSAPSASAQPPAIDPKRLRQARLLMSEAIHNFVGGGGTKGILQRIAAAQSLEDLRAVHEDWLHLLSTSLESPWEVSSLRDRLARVL